MMPRLIPIGLSALLALTAAQGLAAPKVEQLYTQLCASCHGDKLQGGSGPSLIDDVWKHGADDTNLSRSIRDGIPDTDMPGFSDALDQAAVRGLVILIREAGQRAAIAGANIPAPLPDTPTSSEVQTYRLETVAEALDSPWSLAWLPDGRLIFTERPGRLRLIGPDGLVPAAISGTPAVWAKGQGGLLAVSIHPDYASNGWIYLAFSDPDKNGSAMTAIVRGRLHHNTWTDEEEIYRAPAAAYLKASQHFGSRIVLKDGYIYFSIGDRGSQANAQDLTRPNGKIHRLHDDGRSPADNPFAKIPGALPSIWSYGHRNPQGLTLNTETGELWSSEHGPRGGDELNIIRRGANYGWPVITYGMNYNGTPITAETSRPDMEPPVIHWTPSIAVCGINFYTGDRFPAWKNQLFVTSLAAQELRRLVIDQHNQVTHQEVLFKKIGRLRDVATGPDGLLYIAMEQPGRIVRLRPVNP